MGPILCGSHVVTMWAWYVTVITVTLNSHSGYHLPLMPSPEAHDFHHLRFNQVGNSNNQPVAGLPDYFWYMMPKPEKCTK
jgi:sterol desaturase/sphingolipid hydroxylase (fatty acid hydroxylase superfamily)